MTVKRGGSKHAKTPRLNNKHIYKNGEACQDQLYGQLFLDLDLSDDVEVGSGKNQVMPCTTKSKWGASSWAWISAGTASLGQASGCEITNDKASIQTKLEVNFASVHG
jgi:hypothetical protein